MKKRLLCSEFKMKHKILITFSKTFYLYEET